MIIHPHEFSLNNVTDISCFATGWILELTGYGSFPTKSIVRASITDPPELVIEGCFIEFSRRKKLKVTQYRRSTYYETRFFLKDTTLENKIHESSSYEPEDLENYLDFKQPNAKIRCEWLNEKLFKDKFILSSLKKTKKENQIILIGNEETQMTFEIPTDRQVIYSASSIDDLCILLVTHKEFIIIDNPL